MGGQARDEGRGGADSPEPDRSSHLAIPFSSRKAGWAWEVQTSVTWHYVHDIGHILYELGCYLLYIILK